MKYVLSLVLATAFAPPTWALEVDSAEVETAAPAAERLSIMEEVRLRFRKTLAELALLEMRKNDWLFSFAGADAGTPGRRRMIALGDTASGAALLALLGRFAWQEYHADLGPNVATRNELAELREINVFLKDLLNKGMSEAEWIAHAEIGVTPPAMREEIARNELSIARLAERARPGAMRKIGRGVALVVVPALAIGLVADLRSVWLQASVDADQLEAKRSELAAFVRDADTALRNVSR